MSKISSEQPATAHLCLTTGLGGLELYSIQLHQRSLKDSTRNIHFCLKNSALHKKLQELGLEHEVIPWGKYFNPSASLKLRRLIQEQNIKTVYVHQLRNLYLLRPALVGLQDVKVIGLAQIFSAIRKKSLVHRWIYQPVQKLIVLSDLQRRVCQKNLPLHPEQVVTVPNSVDCEKFRPEKRSLSLRQGLGIQDSDQVIGIVGRLDPFKGQYELLEAFARVNQQHQNLKLLIVGNETVGTKGYKERLDQLIAKENLKDRVIFVPFRNDVSELVASMDIFVMPSYEEAFGIVLIEAMASGVPVISTRAGGVPEILEDGKWGDLVEPKNSEAIQKSLSYYLNNKSEVQQRAQEALQMVRKRYHFEDIYQRVVASSTFFRAF